MITILTSKRHQDLLAAERRLLELESKPMDEFVRAFGELPDIDVRGELTKAGVEVTATLGIVDLGSQAAWRLRRAQAALANIQRALS